jgi:hypothetical protein
MGFGKFGGSCSRTENKKDFGRSVPEAVHLLNRATSTRSCVPRQEFVACIRVEEEALGVRELLDVLEYFGVRHGLVQRRILGLILHQRYFPLGPR